MLVNDLLNPREIGESEEKFEDIRAAIVYF